MKTRNPQAKRTGTTHLHIHVFDCLYNSLKLCAWLAFQQWKLLLVRHLPVPAFLLVIVGYATKITVLHRHFCDPFIQKLEKYTLKFNNPSKANDSSSLFYLSSPNIYSISKIFNVIVMINFVLKIFHSFTHWIHWKTKLPHWPNLLLQ